VTTMTLAPVRVAPPAPRSADPVSTDPVSTGQRSTYHRPGEPTDAELFTALHGPDERAAEDACAALVRRYDWLARTSARRYAGRGESDEELGQVAYLGLLLAIRRFDHERGADFAAFARPTVFGELRRHFRDKRRWIKIPRRLQELRLQATAATEELTQRLGREPTRAELAARLGIEVDEVIEVCAADTFTLASLDAPLDAGDPDSGSCGDLLAADDRRIDHVIDWTSLRPLLAKLPEREQRMVELRFYGDRTQSQIAAEFGISQMHVSRLLAATLDRLREQLLA
jgi:RNA polymerase sigma-B factor